MSILLLPFKIVFLIIAFILKGILYLLAFILNFISEVLVALQYILGSIFVLIAIGGTVVLVKSCLLYTSPSPRDLSTSRMPSSA